MLTRGAGTLIFTGATAAIAAARATPTWPSASGAGPGLRMARELGPKGIHVAHVIIDGGIPQEGRLGPAVRSASPASTPTRSPRTTRPCTASTPSTWTQELDLRPWLK